MGDTFCCSQSPRGPLSLPSGPALGNSYQSRRLVYSGGYFSSHMGPKIRGDRSGCDQGTDTGGKMACWDLTGAGF